MAIETFGVSVDSVRRHHFPQFDAFSANTTPSSTTVDEMLDEEGGLLTGRLYLKNVAASSIEADSPAYAQCSLILRKMVALRVLKVMTGQSPELAVSWAAEIESWFNNLKVYGAGFLGDASLEAGDVPATGPVTHINMLGLTLPDPLDASSLTPFLRKDDDL